MIETLTTGINRNAFDAHVHLQDSRIAGVLDTVIADAVENGVKGCRTCGTSHSDWARVAEISRRTDFIVLPAFGVHPWFVETLPADWIELLTCYLEMFPTAAVGETGVDGLKPQVSRELQRMVLISQLELAARLQRAVILHGARAWGELFDICRPWAKKIPLFQLHAFSGSAEQLADWMKLDSVFSVGGAVCNTSSSRVRSTAAKIADDRLLFETDSPDMLPHGGVPAVFGTNFNQPLNLKMVVSACHDLRVKGTACF